MRRALIVARHGNPMRVVGPHWVAAPWWSWQRRRLSDGRGKAGNSTAGTYARTSAKGAKKTSFSIDRSALGGNAAWDDDSGSGSGGDRQAQFPHKEAMTPLGKDLQYYIKMRGAISLHDYIAQTSNHPMYGYYTQQQKTQVKIGQAGDFITSPEISQLFGEMVAVWLISVWTSLGSPAKVRLVELGPGKGTLMKDILRVAAKFPAFHAAIAVHMVEISDSMRQLQREALGCASTSHDADKCTATTSGGVAVTWHTMFSQIPAPSTEPLLLVAQEFLDALPVHQFVYTEKGWREKLVDVDDSPADTDKLHFRSVLARSTTPAVRAFFGDTTTTKVVEADIDALRKDVGATAPSSAGAALKVGDEIEICPLALATVEDIAKQLVTCGGAGLVIDYGEVFTQGDSLRGFKNHQQVSIYSEPGLVDITSDVDFAACAKYAAKKGATVHGAVTQGEFLMRMGIVERLEHLISLESTTEEQATAMVASFRKIVGDAADDGMGKRFKVMAIASPKVAVDGFDGMKR